MSGEEEKAAFCLERAIVSREDQMYNTIDGGGRNGNHTRDCGDRTVDVPQGVG